MLQVDEDWQDSGDDRRRHGRGQCVLPQTAGRHRKAQGAATVPHHQVGGHLCEGHREAAGEPRETKQYSAT